MTATAALTGGCLCGAVAYRCEKAYRRAVHCHCGMCRKVSGAAFMTWVCLPREAFRVTRGEPRIRRSSEQVERAFCAGCGAQLYMDYAGSETVDVSLGTLDQPDLVHAMDNIWAEERLPLAKGFDADLPSHRQFRPER